MDPFPLVDPHASGLLDVGDGNRVYWEVRGNPDGKPAVLLHGGPGGGSAPRMQSMLDPAVYRVVLFDQRGCGKSTPHAADPTVDLSVNTTAHLIADIEALRRFLRVDRWLVFGVSWGTTLGLAYAEQHPERVTEIVLGSVTTTGPKEVAWITEDVGRYFPVEWARFRDAVPPRLRDLRLVDAYAALLADPDRVIREQAARDWCDWEDSHIRVGSRRRHMSSFDDPAFRMCFARLVTHYWRHAAWLDEGELLRGAERLRGIPGVMVTGGLDLSGPPDVAWQLVQAWPDAELDIIDDLGHGGPEMFARMQEATVRFGVNRREQWS